MPSIPAALVGFREYSALNMSTSEMLIETRWLLMGESRASASYGKVTLLVVANNGVKEIIKIVQLYHDVSGT